MRSEGRNGTTSDRPVTSTGDEPVEWSIDRVVPCTSRATHYESADEEYQVYAEEGLSWDLELSRCVEATEEVGKIEVPEAVGTVETHELGVWEAYPWNS